MSREAKARQLRDALLPLLTRALDAPAHSVVVVAIMCLRYALPALNFSGGGDDDDDDGKALILEARAAMSARLQEAQAPVSGETDGRFIDDQRRLLI